MRARFVLLVSLALAVAASPLLPAGAATAAVELTAPGGGATADLVTVNGTLGGVELADAVLAPASSSADSSQRVTTTAKATNASLALLGQRRDVLVEATQTAPPTAPEGVRDELLSVPAAPLLTATVATADARAVGFAEAACAVSGSESTVVASASSAVADATVLPGAVGGPSGGAVTLDNTRDPRGAVVSTAQVALVPQAGAGAAVRSTATTQITSLSLLGGAVVADVLTAPGAVVTAGGSPGKATAELTQPVLRVNGQTLLAGETLRPLGIPGAPVLELTVGNVQSELAPDGTRATAAGNLLTLKVLAAAGAVPLATVTVGDVSAAALAPAGGVRCAGNGAPDGGDGSGGDGSGDGGSGEQPGDSCSPLQLARLDVSAAGVNPGSRFTYTINVANPCDQPVEDVKVVATITSSSGPVPTLVSATPQATSTDGPESTFTLGTIPAGGSRTITLVYEVAADASSGTTYGDTAVITGTYLGDAVERSVSVDLPRVDASGGPGCEVDRSRMGASHRTVAVGDRYTEFVSVYNTGSRSCTGVTVTTELPVGTTFDSCTDSCTRDDRRIVWRLPEVLPGGSRTVAVTALVPAGAGAPAAGTDLDSTATVDADDVDPVRLGPVGPTVAATSTAAEPFTPTRGSGTAAEGGPSDDGRTQGSDGRLADTGSTPMYAVLGLLMVATAVGLRRRMAPLRA